LVIASDTTAFWPTILSGKADVNGQSWLVPPADPDKLPQIPVVEPTQRERLQWESELFGFTASGHPLELFSDIAWDTYCPVNRLGEFVGEIVRVCGLVVEQRIHRQTTVEPMKFLSLADWTGIIETELFAKTYKSYGLATVRYPSWKIPLMSYSYAFIFNNTNRRNSLIYRSPSIGLFLPRRIRSKL